MPDETPAPAADDDRAPNAAGSPADGGTQAPADGGTTASAADRPAPASDSTARAGASGENGTGAAQGADAGTENAPKDGDAEADQSEESERSPAASIEQPAKVMRIGTMIKQLLDEVRSAPLDEAARERLAAIHRQSIKELEEGLSPELIDELERLSLPFSSEQAPSESELRVAQAQLVGWLEGLFHGLQTALVAQQMAAQAQLSHMRRELPPGTAIEGRLPPGVVIQRRADSDEHGPGQYL